MRYLVISDIHLGDGTGSDDFKYETFKHASKDESLLDFIDSLKPDTVILAGDIYELWQHKYKAIKKAHKLLCDTFDNKTNSPIKYIKLIGNHDYKLLGKSSYTIQINSGVNIYITHGFQNDKNMTNPFIRFGVWCLGLVEKIIPNIEVVENVFKKSNVSNLIENNTYNYAVSLMNTYPVVICGHTHNQKIYGTEKGLYYNCGTCQHDKFEGIFIDSEKTFDDGLDFIRMVKK
jgi:UDP-2,3-diacylglucosamine pyrophosphatase LpxH